MNIEATEKLVQLAIGVFCIIALIVFIYIELVNPDLTLSDRAFWALVALGASALALRDVLTLMGHSASRGSTGDGSSRGSWGSDDRRQPERRERGGPSRETSDSDSGDSYEER